MAWRVVIHGCIDACKNSGVEQLRSVPTTDMGEPTPVTHAVAKCLFDATSHALCLRRPPSAVWHVLSICFSICTDWLFPPHMKWKRSNQHVELLWAACCVCRSLVWLSCNRHCRWGRKAGMLLEPAHRQALWREDRPKNWSYADVRAHVDSLLGLQLAAVFPNLDLHKLFGVLANDCAGLYVWMSTRGCYVGIAHARRASRQSSCGVTCRWLEHVALTLRTQCRDSHKLRYKLMRGLRPENFFFLLCRVSDWSRVAAMEQMEIRSRLPNANVRAQGQPKSVSSCKPRARPPKANRERGQRGPFDELDAAAFSRPLPHALSDRLVLPDLSSPTFDSLYTRELQRRFLFHGLFGPVDVYAPDKRQLLAYWCGTKRAVMDWKLLERKWSNGCGPGALSRAVPGLVGRGKKALATRRINAALQARGLPPVRGVCCRVPRVSMLHVFRCVIRRLIFACGNGWNQDEKAWTCSRVRLVPGSMPKMRDAWNAPSISKNPGVVLPSAEDVVFRPGMLRLVPKVWDIPCRPSPEKDRSDAYKFVRQICGQLKLHVPSTLVHVHLCSLLEKDWCYQKEQQLFKATAQEYHHYTSDMTFDPCHEVLVPDDKHKKHMWVAPFACYMWFLAYFAHVAPAWRLTKLTCEQANEWCWSVLDCLLGDRLKSFLGFARYSRVLPYVYGTVKSKCFQGAAWVCQKERHSCFRKVVSCAAWPMRKRWRYIHRALEFVMREVGGGDEVWSLREAADIISSRLQTAKVGQIKRCTCGRCGVKKTPVVAFTADAGQFFEVVSPRYANKIARTILARAARISQKYVVTVLRNAKRKAFFGGTVNDPDTSCSFRFLLDELYLAFVAATLVNLCSIGSSVFHMGGLPIGGVLSKIAASYVLGFEEHAWLCDIVRRSSHGFAASSSSWDCEVARGRYVDDILWVSAVYCHDCLAAALPCIYSVPFTVEPECIVVKWLDMHFCSASLAWRMAPKVWAFPPPWGAEKGFLRSFFGGRFHRWQEVPLDTCGWTDAVVNVFVDLKLAGWPFSLVRAAVFQAWRSPCRKRKAVLICALKRTWRQ